MRPTTFAALCAVMAQSALAAAQPEEPPPPRPVDQPEPVEPPPAPEPPPVPEPDESDAKVAALEQRLAELEQRQRAWEADWEKRHQPEKPKGDAATVKAAPGKGFTVTSADERFSVTLKGRAQVRDAIVHDGETTTNELSVKTVRFGLNGHVLDKDLKYLVQLAFGAGDYDKDNPSPIFDAYVEYTGIRDLNIRVGQFFVPFDRFRTNRDSGLQIIDRPQVIRELSLDRDVGIMLSSNDFLGSSEVVGYHLFVGGGDGRNRVGGIESGPLAVARIVVRPFGMFDDDVEGDIERDDKPRLALGVAGAYNHKAVLQNGTTGSTFTLGTPRYYHGVVDGHFKIAGFSLLAEGLFRWRRLKSHFDGPGVRGDPAREVDGEPAREWTRSGYGYVVQSGVMVHDHVELTARWEQLFDWGNTDPRLIDQVEKGGKQLGGGINGYFNGHAFKIQGDYFYNFGSDIDEGKHIVVLSVDASF